MLMLKLSVFAIVLFQLNAFSHPAANKPANGARGTGPSKCDASVSRIKEACGLSFWESELIEARADKCRQLTSGTGKTKVEFILMELSGKVVMLKTNGDAKDLCTPIAYTIDSRGIKDFKIIANKAFLLSNDGQLYMATADQKVVEIKKADKDSYKGITEISGVQGNPDAIEIKGKTFKHILDSDDVAKRPKRELDFVRFSTWGSVFGF